MNITEDAFWRILEGLDVRWFNYHKSIRGYPPEQLHMLFCPVTAVAWEITKRVYVVSLAREASRVIGLDKEFSRNVILASDLPAYDRALRKAISEICKVRYENISLEQEGEKDD